MFQQFALCLLVTSVFSSTAYAMGKPKPGAFDATAWEGTYQAVDPACDISEVEVVVTPKEAGPTIEFSGRDQNGRERRSETFYQLNGKPYITSNTCFEDGDIFRERVKANAARVQVIVEKMGHNWICMPNHRVKDRWIDFTAERADDVLTVWRCSFKKL